MMPEWFNAWVGPILLTLLLIVVIVGFGALIWMLIKEEW